MSARKLNVAEQAKAKQAIFQNEEKRQLQIREVWKKLRPKWALMSRYLFNGVENFVAPILFGRVVRVIEAPHKVEAFEPLSELATKNYGLGGEL